MSSGGELSTVGVMGDEEAPQTSTGTLTLDQGTVREAVRGLLFEIPGFQALAERGFSPWVLQPQPARDGGVIPGPPEPLAEAGTFERVRPGHGDAGGSSEAARSGLTSSKGNPGTGPSKVIYTKEKKKEKKRGWSFIFRLLVTDLPKGMMVRQSAHQYCP